MRAEMAQIADRLATGLPNRDSAGSDAQTISGVEKNLRQTEDDLRPPPLGWNDKTMPKNTAASWLAKIVGLVLTGFALSLGAPFWFDLLGKFMNLRGAGPKPPRTPEPERRPVLQVQTGAAREGGA